MNEDKNGINSKELVEMEEKLSASSDEIEDSELDDTGTNPEADGNETPVEEVDPAEGEGETDQSDQPEEGESPDAQDAESEISTAPGAQEPFSESLTYMGMDSTAMADIAFIEVEDDGDSQVADWIAEVTEPKEGHKPDKDKAIQQGVEIVGNLTAEANMVINIAAKNYAERAIDIGIACIILKELTRGFDEPWGVWAEKHLPFLGKRNRQKFMMLAKRTDCHDFSYLGVDKLEVLCSLTKDSTGEEPIKALFEKYHIPFDETSEVNMTEFRNQIDAAISNERLVNKGLEINYDLVKNAVNAKVGFNTALIRKIKDIKDCEGNPETYIRNLTINQGSQGSEDTGEETQSRLQDFNSLSSRLVKTIDYIVKDRDHLDSLDKDIFINLYEKIDALLKASGIEIIKKEEE